MIQLYYGDCLDVLRDIQDNSVDCIISDLPFGTTMLHWDVPIDLERFWIECRRVAKKNAAIVLFCSEPFASQLLMSNQEEWRHTLYWVKSKGSLHMNCNVQPLKKVEMIHVFGKSAVHYAPSKEPLERPYSYNYRAVKSLVYGGENFRNQNKEKRHVEFETQSDVLFFNSLHERERVINTQKPVDLLEFLVSTYSCQGDVVLDATAGSGTTGVACKNLNRRFVGVEKDAQHYIIAHNRLFGSQSEEHAKDERLRDIVVANYDELRLAHQHNITFTVLAKVIFETSGYFCKWRDLKNEFFSAARYRGDAV